MNSIKRFGVSIESNLIDKFDRYIKSKNYTNRSEALRDLIRKELVGEEWLQLDKNAAGAIVLVYDHHKRELVDSLIDIQHDYHKIIISTQHIHLDQSICLEIVVVKGKINEIYKLESRLKSTKGVKHISLSKSTLAEDI
ncbi:MAG: nickel-responsive transcriptional regulator NikR [Actinomycetota bacterium]|nr:nickel-responsive transcriptional regulator NikR [Actinomycetota bacterium]